MVRQVKDNIGWYKDRSSVVLQMIDHEISNWINYMRRKGSRGNEIALYILSKLYDRHTVVLGRGHAWCTIRPTGSPHESDFAHPCQVHLLYLGNHIFAPLTPCRHRSDMQNVLYKSVNVNTPEDLSIKPSVVQSSNNVTTHPAEESMEEALSTGDENPGPSTSSGSTGNLDVPSTENRGQALDDTGGVADEKTDGQNTESTAINIQDGNDHILEENDQDNKQPGEEDDKNGENMETTEPEPPSESSNLRQIKPSMDCSVSLNRLTQTDIDKHLSATDKPTSEEQEDKSDNGSDKPGGPDKPGMT